MEVSKQEKTSDQDPTADQGYKLLDAVASMTGLPDPLVQKELTEILELSGQNAGSLTLDELRKAMLVYLEAVAEEQEAAEAEAGPRA